MKFAYLILGAALLGFGGYASYDLVTHSGFSEIQHPALGNLGVAGPAAGFTGLVFMKFQGRRFASRALAVMVGFGVLIQTLGLLPYMQPRLLTPTSGDAGVGLNEILTGMLMLAGMGAFVATLICVLVARADDR